MIIIIAVLGCLTGFLAAFLNYLWLKSLEIKQAKKSAFDLLSSAKDKASFIQDEAQWKVQEYDTSVKNKFQSQIDEQDQKNRTLQSQIDKLSYKRQMAAQDQKEKLKIINGEVHLLQKKWEQESKKAQAQAQEKQNWIEKYKKALVQTFSLKNESLEKELKDRMESFASQQGRLKAQKISEDFEKDLEKNTSRILELVISRFQKSSCEERGIRPAAFKKPKHFKALLSGNPSYIELIEKECGIDIVVNEEAFLFSVQGLDSVRREWGRLVLSNLSTKRRFNKSIVLSAVKQSKHHLFRKIRRDGQRICRSLRLEGASPEVRSMMGALRYRYSFAQNQHFHCEEVGWLCGLISAELDFNIEKGKRAGLFHDIGKAMDHAQSGGHAVIGADFIEKYGEAQDVVYAVRGHHNDVPPKNPLDFFVIAADALSGARPGARRSTVDSYSQKISSLEKIGKSFEGVRDMYVMNAGREIRVLVDSSRVSDLQALQMSKDLARRIEEECSYPGWVKVTVVRKTEINQVIKKTA